VGDGGHALGVERGLLCGFEAWLTFRGHGST
jgi:hypothetical protein